MTCWWRTPHDTHSRRNTIFFVVLACRRMKQEKPSMMSETSTTREINKNKSDLLVENRLRLTAKAFLLRVVASLALCVHRRLAGFVLRHLSSSTTPPNAHTCQRQCENREKRQHRKHKPPRRPHLVLLVVGALLAKRVARLGNVDLWHAARQRIVRLFVRSLTRGKQRARARAPRRHSKISSCQRRQLVRLRSGDAGAGRQERSMAVCALRTARAAAQHSSLVARRRRRREARHSSDATCPLAKIASVTARRSAPAAAPAAARAHSLASVALPRTIRVLGTAADSPHEAQTTAPVDSRRAKKKQRKRRTTRRRTTTRSKDIVNNSMAYH